MTEVVEAWNPEDALAVAAEPPGPTPPPNGRAVPASEARLHGLDSWRDRP
jgi:hypothetical protein